MEFFVGLVFSLFPILIGVFGTTYQMTHRGVPKMKRLPQGWVSDAELLSSHKTYAPDPTPTYARGSQEHFNSRLDTLLPLSEHKPSARTPTHNAALYRRSFNRR